jgi:hypothetical protein
MSGAVCAMKRMNTMRKQLISWMHHLRIELISNFKIGNSVTILRTVNAQADKKEDERRSTSSLNRALSFVSHMKQ